MMPSFEEKKINIEVTESAITKGRYTITASFDSDVFVFPCNGHGYAEQGLFYDRFGIGDSLETSLKKATCEAIKNLKEDYKDRLRSIGIGNEELTKICTEHMKNCIEGKQ